MAGRASAWMVALAVVGVLGGTGCADIDADPPPTHQLGGALVAAWWDDDNGAPVVRVSVTPALAGYHLYSLSHDPAQMGGVGVKTSIGVTGGWRAAGDPLPDQPEEVLEYPTIGLELSVYPSQPVVFTVPVVADGDAPAVVQLSFGLCSTVRCLKPVRDATLPVAGAPPH